MEEFNAQKYSDMYKEMGIDLSSLGCVMLNLEDIDVDIPKDILYNSDNEKRFWIDGIVCDKNAHITALYGLIESAQKNKKYIKKVIGKSPIGKVLIESIDTFDSPYDDEDYICVVGKVEKSDWLMNIHKKLQLFPHINTYPDYKPHVTIAYIKGGADVQEVVKSLNHFVGKELKIIWIDFWK